MNYDVEQISKWVAIAGTAGGLAGGAISGGLNLWWKAREKADYIKVGYGWIQNEPSAEDMMHVVNTCDHQVQIADFGFILDNAALYSFRKNTSQGHYLNDEIGWTERGSSLLEKRNSHYEAGVNMSKEVFGAYARTSTQTRMRIGFRPHVSLRTRVWFRLKIWFNRELELN